MRLGSLLVAALLVLELAGCTSVTAPEPDMVAPPDKSMRSRDDIAQDRDRIDPDGDFNDINERWAGAVCRTRIPVPAMVGNWTPGPFGGDFLAHVKQGQPNLYAGLFMTDDQAATRIGNPARVGTQVEVLGWGPRRPNKRGGAALYLAFPDANAEGRMVIVEQKTLSFSLNLKKKFLDEAEAYFRTEVFRCRLANEQIMAPSRASSSRPPPRPDRVPDIAPGVDLTGVAVEPVDIAAGGEIVIRLDYRVSAPPRTQVTVVEQRHLVKDGNRLASFDNRVSRRAGRFTSRQPVRVPAAAEPGYYEITAEVSVDGGEVATGRALFHVTTPSF